MNDITRHQTTARLFSNRLMDNICILYLTITGTTLKYLKALLAVLHKNRNV